MSDQKFKMHLIVPIKMVGTIIELIADEGILVSVEPVVEKGKTFRYVGGKRNKGISGSELVLTSLRDHGGLMKVKELEAVFVGKGFSTNSVGPSVSKLVIEKKIKRDGNTYRLVK